MTKRGRFVSVAEARNETEAILIRLLLDRIRIPYQVRGEHLHAIYGSAGTTMFGPMEFLVPEELQAETESALEDLFEVNPEDIPETCPACQSPTERGKLECPDCGLHLG